MCIMEVWILSMCMLISDISEKDKPFKTIRLSQNNHIFNYDFPKWYDTIIYAGLDKVKLVGKDVYVSSIPNTIEYKAMVEFKNNSFYIYTVDMDRIEALEVLSHEIIHMSQFDNHKLIYDTNENSIVWNGYRYYVDAYNYEFRPWEREAFSEGIKLREELKSILY